MEDDQRHASFMRTRESDNGHGQVSFRINREIPLWGLLTTGGVAVFAVISLHFGLNGLTDKLAAYNVVLGDKLAQIEKNQGATDSKIDTVQTEVRALTIKSLEANAKFDALERCVIALEQGAAVTKSQVAPLVRRSQGVQEAD